MINRMKSAVILNAKNLIGWKTGRKIVVFSVDDYGNVRVNSKEARDNLDAAGFKPQNRFDRLDALETSEDLEALFDALQSVKDKNGRHAVFTPFSLPCNIDFEKVKETGYRAYHYELLPETFGKLSEKQPDAYSGAWKLWQQGINNGLLAPQFHGREHLNLKVFEEKLSNNDKELITNLENRSFTSLSESGYDTISSLAAFDFWDFNENDRFHEIIRDGLDRFKQVFGYRSNHFTPPVYNSHPVINETLKENGIQYMDTALIKNEHQGKGKFKKRYSYMGKKNAAGQVLIVRNVVFEPTENRGIDWESFAIKQIEAAFRWNRPAVISSHRVNFCGHIEKENRKIGIQSLKNLLKLIKKRWPDVEFLSASELGSEIKRK